jgi:oligosaccharyltransferase complex subunit gamma
VGDGFFVLLFCYGIRTDVEPHQGPPFVHKGQNGQIMYVHGSSQGQFVVETYIVMVLSILFIKLYRTILFRI